jgi:hypothetical protein
MVYGANKKYTFFFSARQLFIQQAATGGSRPGAACRRGALRPRRRLLHFKSGWADNRLELDMIRDFLIFVPKLRCGTNCLPSFAWQNR